MERKQYLLLCQQAAAYPERNIKVLHAGHEYTPLGYVLQFDKHGNTHHTGWLKDDTRGAVAVVDLDALKEAE